MEFKSEKTIRNSDSLITIINNKRYSQLFDLKELWQYRDLLRFLIWRDIKIRYAQSILGIGWAIIQPVFSMIVFTIIFGNLVKIDSDGVPYAIFNYAALVPWTYFSSSLTDATSSLVRSSNMLTKIYFPRLVIPLAPVIGKLLDFLIAFTLLIGMMFFYGIRPTIGIVLIPIFMLIMIMTAAGAGMWLTSLAVQYRDINYAMGFVVQLLLYAAPVVYSINAIPEQFRLLYAINPMVGVIEGFRSVLLGTNPISVELIVVGGISALILFVSGTMYFRYMETIFADVV